MWANSEGYRKLPCHALIIGQYETTPETAGVIGCYIMSVHDINPVSFTTAGGSGFYSADEITHLASGNAFHNTHTDNTSGHR